MPKGLSHLNTFQKIADYQLSMMQCPGTRKNPDLSEESGIKGSLLE